MTTRAPSGNCIAARMKSGRRSALRWMCNPLEDHQVTIRDRDSMEQVRVEIGQVKALVVGAGRVV